MSDILNKEKELTLERYLSIRRQTESICEPLEKEDYVVQPIADVSPPKWHLGHTSWFFETFLLKPLLGNYKEFSPDFSYVFNSYYESVGERVLRTDRGNLSRPTTNEVRNYRAYVDAHMAVLIDTLGEDGRQRFGSFFEIGLQHEQQHQELLVTDIKYILGNNPLFPVYRQQNKMLPPPAGSSSAKYLAIEGGVYEIGYTGESFAWDNEKPQHQVIVPDFQIRDRLITVAEYLEFMKDGGYRDFRHWLAEGWDWVKKEGWQAPMYWHNIDGQWYNYTLNGLERIDPDAPVTHISFYEADAFASWAGKRLPTEQEWEVFAKTVNAQPKGNFLESGIFHPTPASENNAGSQGVYQVLGDCWEWTYSGYFPYPGYRRAEGALGEYNGKFMVNQMVLRGGSCATPSSHIRSSYRNFFHPDKRWQFTGIRLAES